MSGLIFMTIFQLSVGSLVFRNLKPENVGFNIRDDIVLFDFGLAREIREEDKVTDHTWKLTGDTGSLRYMAPEVAQSKPYGENWWMSGIFLYMSVRSSPIKLPFSTHRIHC